MTYIVNPAPNELEVLGIFTLSGAVKLEWRTDPPTETGWYWVVSNENGRKDIQCCMVYQSTNNTFGVTFGLKQPFVTDSIFTHWLGPVPSPDMPKE